MIKALLTKPFPPGTMRRKFVKKLAHFIGYRPTPISYYGHQYFQGREYLPTLAISENVCSEGPLISVVVPAFNTPERYLLPLVYSIISQVYPKWELIIINASTEGTARRRVSSCAHIHKNIKVVEVENKGIAANTNLGIKLAAGEYVAFADHDDILAETALYEFARAIIKDRRAGLLYSDEDKVNDDGFIHFGPFYKPDWSPGLIERVNYINHLTVIRKSLIEEVGGLDPEYDGAQDYDLVLKVTDKNPTIIHIPDILYHWRAAIGSTAQDFGIKKNITAAGKKALDRHLTRRRINATAAIQAARPGFYQIHYAPFKNLTVLITPMSNEKVLSLYLEVLLRKSETSDYAIQVIAPNGVKLSEKSRQKSVVINNYDPATDDITELLEFTKYDQILIVNKILFPHKRNWLDPLIGYLRDDRCLTVAPVITETIDNNAVINDGGLVLHDGLYKPLLQGVRLGHVTSYFGITDWPRNVTTQSGALTVMRSQEWRDFLKDIKDVQWRKMEALVRQFGEENRNNGRVNLVNFDVSFDTKGINLAITDATEGNLYNRNMLLGATDNALAVQDSAQLNILYHLLDDLIYEESKNEN